MRIAVLQRAKKQKSTQKSLTTFSQPTTEARTYTQQSQPCVCWIWPTKPMARYNHKWNENDITWHSWAVAQRRASLGHGVVVVVTEHNKLGMCVCLETMRANASIDRMLAWWLSFIDSFAIGIVILCFTWFTSTASDTRSVERINVCFAWRFFVLLFFLD